MGIMDKFKNLFTEEVEVEEEVEQKEPIKKEMIQVEIPSPVGRRTIVDDEPTVKTLEPEPKEEYKFPFFDDDDFSTLDRPEPLKEEKKKTSLIKKQPEIYKPIIEEKKVFKPSPIISPVYGILDKNYQKEDIKSKEISSPNYFNPKEAKLDEIRKKAYGTLEDDIETTMFGNRVLFDDEQEETLDVIETNIEQDERLMDVLSKDSEPYTADLLGDKPRHGIEDVESDLTSLLEEELGKDEALEKSPKISDSELFNMIDSMYQKGDKEWLI